MNLGGAIPLEWPAVAPSSWTRALYQSGRASAQAFLATSDFDFYIEKFRKGRKIAGAATSSRRR